MRPVNLIPQEERRDRRVSRTGPLAYIVVAGLILLLAGVAVLVTSSNQISERESELATLTARKAIVQAKADRLAPYAKFQAVERQRTATISELADSRFDWPRVIRELSLVLPKYVVLTRLTGLAGGSAGESSEGDEESASSSLTKDIKGPSLSLVGCAANQKRVAALIAALQQIDGVTRVGLSGSIRQITKAEASSEGSSGCLRGNAAFTVAVAFDAAPASPDAKTAIVAAPVEESTESESSSSETTSPESTESESSGSSETTTSETTTVNPPN